MTLLSNQLLLLLDKTVSMYAYMSKNSDNIFRSIDENRKQCSNLFHIGIILYFRCDTCTSTPQTSLVLGDVTTIGL